MVLKGAPK